MFTTAGIVESKSMIFWDIGEIPRVAESWEKTHEKSLIMVMLAANPLYIKKGQGRGCMLLLEVSRLAFYRQFLGSC